MNNQQKIMNAIGNRRQRLEELRQATEVMNCAKRKVDFADMEVARQIKNHCGVGRSVVFEDSIFSCANIDGGLSLSVVPCEYEILISKDG